MALVQPADPMRQALLEGESVTHSIGGVEVILMLTDERHKIDLNTADTSVVIKALREGQMSDADMERAFLQARSEGRFFSSPDELLAPCARISPTASKLQQSFTVWTRGARTSFEQPTGDQKNRPSSIADGFSVYQLNATVRRSDTATMTRRSIVLLKAEAPFIHVLHQGSAKENLDMALCPADH